MGPKTYQRWNRVYSQEPHALECPAPAAHGSSARRSLSASRASVDVGSTKHQYRPTTAHTQHSLQQQSSMSKSSGFKLQPPLTDRRVAASVMGSLQDMHIAAPIPATAHPAAGHYSRRSMSLGAVWSMLGGLGLGSSSTSGMEFHSSSSATGSGSRIIARAARSSTDDTLTKQQQVSGLFSTGGSGSFIARSSGLSQQLGADASPRVSQQAKGSGAISFVVHGPSGTAALLPLSRSLPSRASSASAASAALEAAGATNVEQQPSQVHQQASRAGQQSPCMRSLSLELGVAQAAASKAVAAAEAAGSAGEGVQRSARSYTEAHTGFHGAMQGRLMHRLGRLHLEGAGADSSQENGGGPVKHKPQPLGEGVEQQQPSAPNAAAQAGGATPEQEQASKAVPWDFASMSANATSDSGWLAHSKNQPQRFPSVEAIAPEIADPFAWFAENEGAGTGEY